MTLQRRQSDLDVLEVPLQDDPEKSFAKYKKCLQLMGFLRLVDFLSMTMLTPTLNLFLLEVGGTTFQYFMAFGIASFAAIVSIAIVSVYVDRTGKMFAPYMVTLVFLLCGNVMYIMADVVPAIRHADTIILSRVIMGFGVGNAGLCMAFIGRAVPPTERQKWAGLYSMTRTGGLMLGPALTVMLQYVFNSAEGDKASIHDLYALPATFLTVLNVVGLISFPLVWVDPPEAVKKDAFDMSQEKTLCRFFCQPRILVLLSCFISSGFLVQVIEPLVPVVASQGLGWTSGKEAGYVLIAIGVVVISAQIFAIVMRNRMRIQDLFLLGTWGCCLVSLITLGVWLAVFGTSIPVSQDEARDKWFFVMFPFVIAEATIPVMGISAITLFTNSVQEEVPTRAASAQGLFLNIGMFAMLLAPAWSAVSYSDDAIEAQGIPWVSMQGVALTNCVMLLGTLVVFPQLVPASSAPNPAEVGTQALPTMSPEDEALLYSAERASMALSRQVSAQGPVEPATSAGSTQALSRQASATVPAEEAVGGTRALTRQASATVPEEEAVLYHAEPASTGPSTAEGAVSPKAEPSENTKGMPVRTRTRSFEVSTPKTMKK